MQEVTTPVRSIVLGLVLWFGDHCLENTPHSLCDSELLEATHIMSSTILNFIHLIKYSDKLLPQLTYCKQRKVEWRRGNATQYHRMGHGNMTSTVPPSPATHTYTHKHTGKSILPVIMNSV